MKRLKCVLFIDYLAVNLFCLVVLASGQIMTNLCAQVWMYVKRSLHMNAGPTLN